MGWVSDRAGGPTRRRRDSFQHPVGSLPLGVGSGPVLRRELHVRRGRDRRRPDGGPRRRLPGVAGVEPPQLVAVATVERYPRRQAERPSSLRSRKRVLPALAGPGDGVHLRVLSDA